MGSLFRTAESFGIAEILLSDGTADPGHPRAARSSMGCTETVAWRRAALGELENRPGVFALETGYTDVETFSFPREGVMIIGSEELGVSPEGMRIAKQSGGVVSIEAGGAKASLNVGVAAGIAMFRWFREIQRLPSDPGSPSSSV